MWVSSERPRATLLLQDGSAFHGAHIGAESDTTGLVVFNTSMTGYEEMLTDPSYGGQILVATYPLIGNYGISLRDAESARIQVQGFVVRQHCDQPSHPQSRMTVHEYLRDQGIPGITDVDTRAITRRIRTGGAAMGAIVTGDDLAAAQRLLDDAAWYGDRNWVDAVATDTRYDWSTDAPQDRAATDLARRARLLGDYPDDRQPADAQHANDANDAPLRIAVIDLGVKRNILRSLQVRGCVARVFPPDASAAQIRAYDPHGIVLSPGPGDPQLLDTPVETIRQLLGIRTDTTSDYPDDAIPTLGICLGHQLAARALGADTFMLHFGHRGGNQPVLETASGRVYVTAHNHGYAVDAKRISDLEHVDVTHINLNDNTVEGIASPRHKLMTIQFHSEASPGPHDSELLFDRFIDMVNSNRRSTQATPPTSNAPSSNPAGVR